MNIANTGIFCSSKSFGGLEINTLRLIRWMGARGNNIAILAGHDTPVLRQAMAEGMMASPIRRDGFLAALRSIRKWVRETGITTIIIPYRQDLKVVTFYKRFFNPRIKIVYQQHMQLGLPRRGLIHTIRYRAIDAWVAPLPYLKEETLRFTKVPEEKIHVIPFGIEPPPLMDSTYTAAAARRLFDLPEDKIIIGALGRLDRQKGQDTLIKALHLLRSQHRVDAHLLIVGDATLNEGDAYSECIAALIKEYGLEDAVHLRPYQSDVAVFFRAVDVFAMPSHNETYGMVTLEAMAAGVPVIGTDAGGTPEMLENGALGYLFTPQNEQNFVATFRRMSGDLGLHERLEAARAAILRHYTAAQMCAAYEVLLA